MPAEELNRGPRLDTYHSDYSTKSTNDLESKSKETYTVDLNNIDFKTELNRPTAWDYLRDQEKLISLVWESTVKLEDRLSSVLAPEIKTSEDKQAGDVTPVASALICDIRIKNSNIAALNKKLEYLINRLEI